MAEMNDNTPFNTEDENEILNQAASFSEELEDSEMDLMSNEDDTEDHEEIDEHEEDELDVTAMSKQELVAFVESVVKNDTILQSSKLVSQARDRFKEIFDEEKQHALDAFLAIEGNVEVDFEYQLQYIDRQWREAIRNYGMRKKAIKEGVIAEREQNLKKKLQLLENLKEITEKAVENDAFDKLKALQTEWRNIGQVPVAELDSLNKNYRFLTDKFFDQRALIKEFLDYDKKKNLEAKTEIIAHMEHLAAQDNSLRDLMRHFRSLQDSWRDTGPVPRENLDEIMNAYRSANDKITQKKNSLVEVVDGERKENLNLKERIIAGIVALTSEQNNNSWSKKNLDLSSYIEAWKKVGSVPRADNQKIRKEFTEAVKEFNKLKNTFFKEQKREKMVNVELREQAIKRVEDLLTKGGDLKEHRNEIIKLQKNWKNLGHVPRKQGDELWNKFRSVCNAFFDRLKEGDKAKNEEEENHLKAKIAICEAVEQLQSKEDLKADDLIPFEEEWQKIGFVPFAQKKEVDKRFKDAVKQVLMQTVKLGDVKPHLADFKIKIEEMMRGDKAYKTLDEELNMLRKKSQKLQTELNTLETNIQFFANSKGADKLIGPIKKQIEEIKTSLTDLKDKEIILKQSIDLLRD